MKLKLLQLFIALTIVSCSSVKKTQEAINYGNYDEAIQLALKNLRADKYKKNNKPYITMLEDAYGKATERDLEKIAYLKKDGNQENLQTIFNLYNSLNNRQQQIKPLLPLPPKENNQEAIFNFRNYSNELVSSKNELSSFIYNKSINCLENCGNKQDFRATYNNLKYLQQINPNFNNTDSLLNEAHFKGSNFVFVKMINTSNKVIPKKLEKDLLNFKTYQLNSLWTTYDSKKQQSIDYDYNLTIFLDEINISPEQVKEKETLQEREVKDGWVYVKNEQGEIKKDSLGNNIKRDVYKKVSGRLNIISQNKYAKVVGFVEYFDNKNNENLESFPLASEFIFDNVYAQFRGNRKVLNKEQLKLVNNRFIPFPSNEQMIYDSGENLKQNIKNIIITNKFIR